MIFVILSFIYLPVDKFLYQSDKHISIGVCLGIAEVNLYVEKNKKMWEKINKVLKKCT